MRPSLSLAETSLRAPLLEWVDASVSEGVAEARRRGAPVLHAAETSLDGELPLWVFDSSLEEVHFFMGRSRAVLGLGAATAARTADLLWRPGPPRALSMGGWGFPHSMARRERAAWASFPQSRWVTPALWVSWGEAGARLGLAVRALPSSRDGRLRGRYRALASALDGRRLGSSPRLPRAIAEKAVPSDRAWLSLAGRAIGSISRGELKKVVLSRALELTFSGRLPGSEVLRRLLSLNPDSTVFAVKMGGSVFLGASPEALVSVGRGGAEVDCLAASSPRGRNASEDELLGSRLLADPKSLREHQFVVQAAVSALAPLSSRVEVPGAPVLKKLTTIQHLYTPVRATLLDQGGALVAARALWPSPAVGGEPKDEAVRWIQRHEGLERGWFSGVVGLIEPGLDEARLVLALRSGVLRGRRAVIYAGAGLVAGSDPGQELEETGWKLRTMKRALGIEPGAGG